MYALERVPILVEHPPEKDRGAFKGLGYGDQILSAFYTVTCETLTLTSFR